jgi:hypothetical protein
VNSNILRLSYKINSIQVEPIEREYTIIRGKKTNIPLSDGYIYEREFNEKLTDLAKKERDIFEQLKFYVSITEPVEQKKNELVEKRDTMLESIILLSTRFCANKYVKPNSSLCPFDMFVFFATKSLFDYLRPYVKFWEIMKRVGY